LQIEEAMLEDYFLLVRRIHGLSLSPTDFWELDTFTTQKLLNMEVEILKREQEEYDKLNNKNTYVERPDGNSEEMNDIVDDMSEDL
jgi:hypothetical protein